MVKDQAFTFERVIADGCTFSPDGKWLLTGGHQGVRIFNSYELRSDAPMLDLDSCSAAAIHPSGSQIVTFGVFSKLYRWPFKTGEPDLKKWQVGPAARIELNELSGLNELETQHRRCSAVWNRDGSQLVVADYRNGRVLIFDEFGNTGPKVLGELVNAQSIDISSDNRWVAAAAELYPHARVWSAPDGKVVFDYPHGYLVKFSEDGRQLAISTETGIQLFHVGTWTLDRTLARDETSGLASPVAFQPHGQLMAYSPAAGMIRLCDRNTGICVANIPSREKYNFNSLAFSPDGTRIAFTSALAWDV